MAQAGVTAEVTQALCAAGGALELTELRRRLRDGVGADALERLLRERRRFAVVARAGGAGATPERVVLAVSALRLCHQQGPKATCAGLCGQLHFCKFTIYGACKFQKAGKNCRNGHILTTAHNLSVLKTHGVDHLSYSELCQLLFQNDPWLLPEICLHYNKGNGLHGSCTFQEQCIKLHVCQYFLQGECKFGTGCKRSHDFSNSENLVKLQKLGMSSDLVSRLPSIYRNAHDIKNKSSASSPQGTSERRDSSGSVSSTTSNQEESDEICLYHIRKSCSFQEKCNRVHFHLPYRWQFLDGGRWKDFDKMEFIEEAYCNPKKDRVLYPDLLGIFSFEYVNFESMKFGPAQLRRLSTASSVTKPPHFILTTEWIWYWSDDFGSWQEYGKQDVEHPTATISSSDLEKAYLAYCASGSDTKAATLKFQAGKHKYELNFRDFIQKNVAYGKLRKVCRRPKYVSSQEVKMKQTCSVTFQGPKNIPDHWDLSALPDPGFQLITLHSSSEEYEKVYNLFNRTLPYYIQKIERVQNLALWEVYQWQKGQMQKRNGGRMVDERQLFHGTSAYFVDAICQQNFDWRVCGLHGTSYGKGSYFARDAAYSHHYSKSDSKFYIMFLARVLVGEFTRGNASFVRPPAKDGRGNSVFYDSCVNSMSDPSIFVIFEKHQAYPEYVIQYSTSSKPAAGASTLFSLASFLGFRQ
ncbi:protein mono-ADP-ribosyltransferase PARP12 [Saccopteryx leptura]|uniref:protein mono-ADP-ribosyltransferase PARP12 n=1 Tax=Saccopteryx leptura TaxID=249018 RepID=UPI00339BDB85